MAKNNIAIFTYSKTFPGGLERRFARVFKFLIDRRFENVFFIINEELFDYLLKANILTLKDKRQIIYFSFLSRDNLNFLKTFFDICKLLYILKKENITKVHIAFSPFAPFLTLLIFIFKILKLKVFISSVNSLLIKKEDFSFLKFLAGKLNYRLCDKIDFLSDLIKVTHSKIFSIKSSKTFVSPCSFIDFSKFKNYNPISQRKIDITFLGRIIKEKGIDLLLDTLSLLRNKKLQVHIVGSGELKSIVLDRVRSIRTDSLEVKVYKSFFPEKILTNSKIFLSLQMYNNYPSQALLEAMAAGTAIIATNTGETYKLIRDMDTGILISPNCYNLREKILFLLKNPTLMEKIGRNARRFVFKHYTIENFVEYLKNELWY